MFCFVLISKRTSAYSGNGLKAEIIIWLLELCCSIAYYWHWCTPPPPPPTASHHINTCSNGKKWFHFRLSLGMCIIKMYLISKHFSFPFMKSLGKYNLREIKINCTSVPWEDGSELYVVQLLFNCYYYYCYLSVLGGQN